MEVNTAHPEELRGADMNHRQCPWGRTWSLTSELRAWGQGCLSAHHSPPLPRNVQETLPLSPAGDLGALGSKRDPAVWI